MLTSLLSLPAESQLAPENIKVIRHSTSDTLIDDALVRRFLAGDEEAFVEIMARYRSKIFAANFNLLHNHADAEEITQDTFIRAHRALAKFRGDSSLSTWLHRIARNLSYNRYWHLFRRHKQDSCSLDCALSADHAATPADLMADPGWSPVQAAVATEFAELTEDCMTRLAAPHHEILAMRNHLNHSYGEIAAILGISIGTVKSRIARARNRLRALLVETCPEFTASTEGFEWFLPSRTSHGHLAIACA